MLSFPESLPAITVDSRSTFQDNTINTTVQGPNRLSRILNHNRINQTHLLDFEMTAEQLNTFISFYENDIEYGHRPFNINIAGNQYTGKITEGYTARIIDVTGDLWNVRFTIYTKQGIASPSTDPTVDDAWLEWAGEVTSDDPDECQEQFFSTVQEIEDCFERFKNLYIFNLDRDN